MKPRGMFSLRLNPGSHCLEYSDTFDEAFWILCDDLPYVLAPAELFLLISIRNWRISR
jgi:hypothetical protein